ncbi:MAG: hypothetical protein RLZZ292_1032 [Bacteroidota bacterium]|jgi:phage tail-like protein
MAADSRPVAAFHFEVRIDGSQLAFQEASGFDVSIDTEDIKEGGANNYIHKVPTRTKFSNLVLKRGIIQDDPKPLLDWLSKTIITVNERDSFLELKSLTLILKDASANPMLTWSFERAYPVKWSFGKLNAQENTIAFDSIEFVYKSYSVS